MRLSVVIPVYGVEAFLRKCVDSVVAQAVDDIEIILIDDCSPDACGEICDKLAAADSRIRVVHRRENGGLSAARNSGIAVATGDLLTFVDSDDFLAADTYRPCLRMLAATGADCVEYPVVKRYGSASPQLYNPAQCGDRVETFDDWFRRHGYIHSYACNKIYRRRLWGDTRFPEGRYFEDLLTVPYVLSRARGIAVCGAGFYFYCSYNAGAITQNPSERNQRDLLDANFRLFAFFQLECGYDDGSMYDYFMELLNRKIGLLRAGGDAALPDYVVRWRYALRRQPVRQRLKCLLWLMLGERRFFKLFR